MFKLTEFWCEAFVVKLKFRWRRNVAKAVFYQAFHLSVSFELPSTFC